MGMKKREAVFWIGMTAACLAYLLAAPSFAAQQEDWRQYLTEEERAFDEADAAGLVDGPGYELSLRETGGSAAASSGSTQNGGAAGSSVSSGAGRSGFGNVITEESTKYVRGSNLGTFSIVGYYGAGPTYSGKYTIANHTVAADLAVLPLGTKIFIGDTVYTVEDIGSGVVGNIIDIYFDSYEEAVGVTHDGHKYAEVYLAVPK